LAKTTIERLLEAYEHRKTEIRDRIREFQNFLKRSDTEVFAELCFCLCTPQSQAIFCWNAVSQMAKRNLLLTGSQDEIAKALRKVRFRKVKAKYIIEARKVFMEKGEIAIKKKILSFSGPFEARAWLVRNVKGIGMKEASHFLRNIGLGLNLAILDRHILGCLEELGVIECVPKSLTRKIYEDIERRMLDFSRKIKIPMADLDLLLWSLKTGFIFK